jgi:hypothetical protein
MLFDRFPQPQCTNDKVKMLRQTKLLLTEIDGEYQHINNNVK